jgi:hypothetical protein
LLCHPLSWILQTLHFLTSIHVVTNGHTDHYHKQRFYKPLHTFRSSVNLLLVHTVVAILNCRFFENFTTFHTLWPQKSDQRLLLSFGEFFRCNSYATLVEYYHCWKHIENHLDPDESGGFLLFKFPVFNVTNATIEENLKYIYCWLFPPVYLFHSRMTLYQNGAPVIFILRNYSHSCHALRDYIWYDF